MVELFAEISNVPHSESEQNEGELNLVALSSESVQTKDQKKTNRVPFLDRVSTQLSDQEQIEFRVGIDAAMKNSPTLNHLVQGVARCPWGGEMSIKLVDDTPHLMQRTAEYDPTASQVVLGRLARIKLVNMSYPNQSQYDMLDWLSEKLAKSTPEKLAFCLHMATHKPLQQLYGADAPVSESEYQRLMMNTIAGAYLAEIKVNDELGNETPVVFSSQDLRKFAVFKGNASSNKIDNTMTQKNVLNLLSRTAIPAELQSDYAAYRNNFEINRKHLLEKKYIR